MQQVMTTFKLFTTTSEIIRGKSVMKAESGFTISNYNSYNTENNGSCALVQCDTSLLATASRLRLMKNVRYVVHREFIGR